MNNVIIRDDLDDYEVLENEAEGFVDDKKKALEVTELWIKATYKTNCSMVTIGESEGKLFAGYHHTMSDLTPVQLVGIGRYIAAYNGLVSLTLWGDDKEAYITFYFPVRVLRNRKVYQKLVKTADRAVAQAWHGRSSSMARP